MNKISLLLLAGFSILSTQGCSYVSDFIGLGNEAEINRIEPNSVSVNAVDDPEEQLETQVLESEAESSDSQQIASLIPATNPDARVRSVTSGRQDPFSAINVRPQIEIEEDESATDNVQLPPRVTSTPTFEPPDDDDFFESPPEDEFFEPTLAREVVVTGVVKVDGRDKIIVNAPEESSSRYVEVGQYISNGQILVKSIDFNNFPAPVVIFEQFGVEVAKEVGESADSEESEFVSHSNFGRLSGG